MARWLDAHWEHSDLDMVPRADRLVGPYRQYEPELVTSRPLSMSPEANRAGASTHPDPGWVVPADCWPRTQVLRRRPWR